MLATVRAMQFGPDDEDAFEAFKDVLITQFEATPDGAGAGWVADQVLNFKYGYLDGDLEHWSEGDVRDMLFELYPRKVVLEPSDHPHVIAGMAAFLRFLEVAPLATLVEASATRFDTVMADRTRWGMGKSLLGGLGVQDQTDPAQLQAMMEAFNALPYAERAALTGGPVWVLPPFPPVVLAPTQELEAAARASLWLSRVHTFTTYAGAGRSLTATDNLRLADARTLVGLLGSNDVVDPVVGDKTYKTISAADLPALDLTYVLALGTGYVTVVGHKLGATDDADRGTDVLLEWAALLDVLLHEVGILTHSWRDDPYGFGWFAADLDRLLPAILIDLYRQQTTVELADMAADNWQTLQQIIEWRDDAQREQARRGPGYGLLEAMRRLAEFGVVELTGAEDKTEDREVPGQVRLTPLGTWALHAVASTVADAPTVGGLADLDAAQLLERAADLPEDVAAAEVRHWLSRHTPELLVDTLPAAGEVARGLAFGALLELGPGATEAVERLREHPELWSYAPVWRVDTLQADETEMVMATPERWVRLLHAVLELIGPHAACAWAWPAAGPTGVPAMLEQAWRIRLPQTSAVLDTLGTAHPDKAIAKAARKVAFKFRSAQ